LATFSLFRFAIRIRLQPEVPLLTVLWAFLILAVLFFHLQRPDKLFLQMLGGKRRVVYALEYTVGLLPFPLFGFVSYRPGLSLMLMAEIALLTGFDYDLRRHRIYQFLVAGEAQADTELLPLWAAFLSACCRQRLLNGGADCAVTGLTWSAKTAVYCSSLPGKDRIFWLPSYFCKSVFSGLAACPWCWHT
jgi:hypothetical protein